MGSSVNWASGLENQGLDLSTCQYLKFVYTKFNNKSNELSEIEIKEATLALQKISKTASFAMRKICYVNKINASYSPQFLINNPKLLTAVIRELFRHAYDNHLSLEEKNFVESRLCSYKGHQPKVDHTHFNEDFCKTIFAFYELSMSRYTFCPPPFPNNLEDDPEEILPPRDSLVQEFAQNALKDPDIWSFKFYDYLFPDETYPERIKEHLSDMGEGVIVSVGTERSLFDLLFAPESCTGIVTVDVNPRVKAYNDFNLLLICISSTPEEYVELSSRFCLYKKKGQKFERRIFKIQEKLAESPLPNCVKNYYQRNLFSFGTVFFSEERWWRDAKYAGHHIAEISPNSFVACRYDQNLEQFNKIRDYAIRGDIITVVGPIQDLTFLKGRSISVVDISNVGDYFPINIKGLQEKTKVVWTQLIEDVNNRVFIYSSYKQSKEKINRAEQNELESLLDRWIKEKVADGKQKSLLEWRSTMQTAYYIEHRLKRPQMNEKQLLIKAMTRPIGPFYTRSALRFLRSQFKVAN